MTEDKVSDGFGGGILFIVGLLVLSLLAFTLAYDGEKKAHAEDCRKFLPCERGAGQLVDLHCVCVAPAQEVRR